MLKDLIEEHAATEAIIDECFCQAIVELKKITCFDIPELHFEDPRTFRWRADIGIVTDTFSYVLMDGKYYEQCDTYERGISYRYIGDTEDDMTAHLIFETVWHYAIHNTEPMTKRSLLRTSALVSWIKNINHITIAENQRDSSSKKKG